MGPLEVLEFSRVMFLADAAALGMNSRLKSYLSKLIADYQENGNEMCNFWTVKEGQFQLNKRQMKG